MERGLRIAPAPAQPGEPLAHLRRMLEQDELALLCQPIAQLTMPPAYPLGEIFVRLREEENALLPPGEFFPVFEHFRLMPELDRWVVRHALRRLSAGLRIPKLAINLSDQTLEDERFPDFVADELARTRVRGSALLFEIHERDALERSDAALRFAAAIRQAGCAVLIDGFGAQSVSFASLKSLRPEFVKIDGSVVRQVITSNAAKVKMEAFLRVGTSLGIGLIAECVEEQDVLARLKMLGVGYAQGFGIIQPQPIEAFS